MSLPLKCRDDETPDVALVARVRAGDAGAYEILFRRHYERLCRYARTYARSKDGAEDVVQDVLAQVWRERREWVVRGTVSAYLYAAVRHRVMNVHRRIAVERRWAVGVMSGEHASAPPADVAADERALADAITAGITSLPARCREVFLLRRQHGLSHAEIAAIMGITPKTVEVQIGRAMKALRRALASYLTIVVLMR